MPRGDVAWPIEEDAQDTRLLAGLAVEFARIDARVETLITESDPRSAHELLPAWEHLLGLPDKCNKGLTTTIPERREAVVAKLTMMGGASKAFFIALAASLGYDIIIDEFRPFICGLSRCGDRLNGPASVRHVWRVRVSGPRFTPFRSGISQCGDRLGKITRADDLECKLFTIKPAHTHLIFNYEGA